MKKIFSLMLVLMFMLTVIFAAYAVAEALEPPASPAEPAAAAFTVNLTGLIVAILVAFFEFLLAWLLKAVIPPLKQWLDSHTTKNQQQLIWNVVKRLVEAAEQTITGLNKGEQKMAWVKSMLQAHGYSVDTYVIEAAVKEMNDRALVEIAHELDIDNSAGNTVFDPDTDDEDDETE